MDLDEVIVQLSEGIDARFKCHHCGHVFGRKFTIPGPTSVLIKCPNCSRPGTVHVPVEGFEVVADGEPGEDDG